MRVSEIMTHHPITALPTERVTAGFAIMRDNGFKHLPIISVSGHLVGIVSLDDCRVQLGLLDVTDDIPHSTAQLRDIMVNAPIVTDPTQDVFLAAQLMYRHHIHALPVMIEETLVGIMTSSDLLIACLQTTQKLSYAT
jgi:acetoin utilization protein AcuB